MNDATARALFDYFFQAADDFAAMQQEHQAALLAGSFKELFRWQQNREKAFRSLAHVLERVVVCGDVDQETLARVRASVAELLTEEDVLQKLIVARQLKVQGQLPAMRKGKEALQGYNINKGQVTRPRYLSNRM
ncbi:MAG TPA: hypothetical protein DEQ20_07740 [Desulfobulbaceae bacterium]|nr:MAG: hypothetical protein A2520_04040 [Deltaproteobacteria bacterium RIFOXYD12_FULL_53_23]HCC54798.1 hypothetical protein [Desulfobulbaceae bacterium]